MLANYLAAEPLLIARLREHVAGVRAVLSAADLAGLGQASQVTPALFVLYQGDQVPGGDAARGARGAPQKIAQRWLAVVAVRNARTQTTGAAAREDAGPLIGAVIHALAGWQPGAAFGPLKRAAGPPPDYDGPFAYFPLLFTTEIYT